MINYLYQKRAILVNFKESLLLIECYCGSGKKFKKCCYWRELKEGTLIGGNETKKTD